MLEERWNDDNRKQIPKVLEFVNVRKKKHCKIIYLYEEKTAVSKEKILN